MADTTTTKRQVTTISDEDRQALTGLREMLNQRSDEAIQESKTYIAGILTELLAHVDKEVNRVNKFSGRLSVASKRQQVRALRKAQTTTQGTANQSQTKSPPK